MSNGCRQCSRYVTKECEKVKCPYFTGNYPTVRIKPDKRIITPKPKSRKYGLSIKELCKLLKNQDDKCAICNRKEYLTLDHNHLTNKARGYLCRTCNTLLSGFDRPVWREQAEKYLDNPPAKLFYK